MGKDIKNVISRSTETLVADLLGILSLVIMLYGSLSLPSLF